MIIRRAKIVTSRNVIDNGYIVIDNNGTVLDIGREPYRGSSADNHEDLSGFTIVPGFIDTHIHGLRGIDITFDSSLESILEISRELVKHGVTSFIPTTLSASHDVLVKVCRVIRDTKKFWRSGTGARVLGLHLEGPFINKEMAGAHRIEFIRKPSIYELDKYIEASDNNIIQITIAPEVENALPFISYAKSKGIVISIGHTNASYEIGVKAIKAGATKATHIFNAMRRFHHRDPGIVLALIESSDIFLEVIADDIHIHPAIVRFLTRYVGINRIVLISDSISVTGMSNGVYDIGGIRVRVEDGIAKLIDKNILIGGTATMYNIFRNMLNLGFSLVDVVKMCSIIPAKSIGLDNIIGDIDKGYKADLVVLDKDLRIEKVYVEGQIVYET